MHQEPWYVNSSNSWNAMEFTRTSLTLCSQIYCMDMNRYFWDLLLIAQGPLQVEYNVGDPNKPTNFSNPMYENFGDMPTPESPKTPPKVSIEDISTTLQPSPNSEKPIEEPAHKKHKSKGSNGEVTGNGTRQPAGFKPTTVDTDVDTQALVEMEDDEWWKSFWRGGGGVRLPDGRASTMSVMLNSKSS